MMSISLQVNGETHAIDVEPATPLLFVLRNYLGLTGAKLGCGLEQCGACAVLVDGQSTLSCSRAVSDFQGRAIATVESLARGNQMSRVQQAFVGAGAAQCGYCIPGFVVAVTGMLESDPNPDAEAIQEALSSHLCRCGSHGRIKAAIDSLVGPRGAS